MISALLVGFSQCGGDNATKVHHPLKADTFKVYLQYFKELYPQQRDTAAFAIKITYDTLMAATDTKDSTVIKKAWRRDSIYYVPYDTLMPDPKDTSGKTKKLNRILLLLPRYWDITEYPKTSVPLTTRPG